MPTDPAKLRDADHDDATSLSWWLSGGASLLVWTGVALLLTTA